MSTSETPLYKLCHFQGALLRLQPYLCYSNEICCKEGCCSRLSIVIVFVIYRYICWFCRRRNTPNVEVVTLPQSGANLDSQLINLMVSYGQTDYSNAPKDDEPDSPDPPPAYSVAVNLPAPQTSNEKIPTYEEAVSG